MSEQKFKITNNNTNSDVFFCDQALKSAKEQAEDYIMRNQGKFEMTLYIKSSKPRPYPLWVYVRFIPGNTPTQDTPQ